MSPDVPSLNGTAEQKVRLSGIEAGRGLAASVVVIAHAWHNAVVHDVDPGWASIFAFGHAGVVLFFVISGFVITYAHYADLGHASRLAHYVARRFQRVFPLYWVALAVAVLVGLLRSAHGLPSAISLLCNFVLWPSNDEAILDVAWTLHFEMVFYVVMAVAIVSRWAGLAVGALWLVGVLVFTTTGALHWLPIQFRSSYCLEFLFGVIAALWLRVAPGSIPRGMVIAGAASFAVSAWAEDIDVLDGHADLARFCYGLASMMLVVGSASASLRSSASVPGWLRRLGAASYSIYLFQFFFISAAWQAGHMLGMDQRIPGWATVLVQTSAALIGGMMASRVIEYPLLGLTRRWMASQKSAVSPELAASKGKTA